MNAPSYKQMHTILRSYFILTRTAQGYMIHDSVNFTTRTMKLKHILPYHNLTYF